MNSLLLIAASGFGIGLLGSFHCIGMCGPIALALPIHQLDKTEKSIAILLYNIGRAFTYAFLGVLVGVVGQSISFFGFQQWLSIIAGLLILTFLLAPYLPNLPPSSVRNKWNEQLKKSLSNYLSAPKNVFTYAIIGMINGLLPCGLVYVALASAIAVGSLYGSSLLMFSFGIGTIPIMASLMVFGKYISPKLRVTLNKAVPYFVLIMAILLITRGMGLGIPYVSPALDSSNGKCAVSCCHKP